MPSLDDVYRKFGEASGAKASSRSRIVYPLAFGGTKSGGKAAPSPKK